VFDGSNTLIRRYLYGPNIDQVLADENVVPKQAIWALSDHQGSVRDWVNNTGVLQNHIRYDSFGKIVSQTAPALNPRFAYTGREWDGEIGLYFYRARYYDPTGGRLIGEDPIGFTAQDTNLYRYVFNSTMNRIDPTGLQVEAPVKSVPTIPFGSPSAPPPGPWYIPLLRAASYLTTPLIIPGGILNPLPVGNEEAEYLKKQRCKDGNKKKTCQSEFPHLVPCNIPGMKRYLFPSAEDARNAAFPNGYKDNRALANRGPCSTNSGYEPGYHWNVKDRRRNNYIGSVGQCNCCEENPTPYSKIKGAVLSPEPH
jgi:RHS repeat-associated protein